LSFSQKFEVLRSLFASLVECLILYTHAAVGYRLVISFKEYGLWMKAYDHGTRQLFQIKKSSPVTHPQEALVSKMEEIVSMTTIHPLHSQRTLLLLHLLVKSEWMS
jgi:hypothetical protein